MNTIPFGIVLKGKNVVDKNRKEIYQLVQILLGMYRPDKKYPEFTKKEGEVLEINTNHVGCWRIYCVNSSVVSGISKIEWRKIVNGVKTKVPTAVFTHVSSGMINDGKVRTVHKQLQSLLDGFVDIFPETLNTLQMYADEAAYA